MIFSSTISIFSWLLVLAILSLVVVMHSSRGGGMVRSEPNRQRRQKNRESIQEMLKPKVTDDDVAQTKSYSKASNNANINTNTNSNTNSNSNNNGNKASNSNNNINSNINSNNNVDTNKGTSATEIQSSTTVQFAPYACPLCPVKAVDRMKYSLQSFWLHKLAPAFACSCQQIQSKKDDGLAQSILYSLYYSRHFSYPVNYAPIDAINVEPTFPFNWDVIGPFPVGKLELDGDPFFPPSVPYDFDIASYVLGDMSNSSYVSELFSHASISWRNFPSKPNGQVDVHFSVLWNDLVQGISSAAALEFQGWARTTTFVRQQGIYLVSCQGVHSVYVRNDNTTRFITGDIYRSNMLEGVVDLRPGPVGIIVPLRAVAQLSFSCKLTPATSASASASSANSQKQISSAIGSFKVYPPTNIPDLLELDVEFGGKMNHAILFSNLFTLPIMNRYGISISVEIKIEPPAGFQGDYSLVVAKNLIAKAYDKENCHFLLNPSSRFQCRNIKQQQREFKSSQYSINTKTILPPGQMVNLPVQLLLRPRDDSSESNVFIPCRRGAFQILIVPSRGSPEKISLELPCRRINQSFLISYFDQDDSVAQAGILFPLRASPDVIFHESLLPTNHKKLYSTVMKPMKKASSKILVEEISKTAGLAVGESISGSAGIATDNLAETAAKFCHRVRGGVNLTEYNYLSNLTYSYPLVLSLHGTGISPGSQADSYKYMPQNCKEYIFGVEGFWVVAPSRHGAHNWEAIGETAALNSMIGLDFWLSRFPHWPQLDMDFSIFAGHSMGGHGAWVLAMNSPDKATCISAAASWISKEEYGNANNFFDLDVSNSFVDPSLKTLFERSWGEFHVDRHVLNYQGKNVYIRVGASDMTTHPWYSRRMLRLLKSHGINTTYDEIHTKQHWWWDTDKANDGGVMNDGKMRQFYVSCLQKSNREWKNKYAHKCGVFKTAEQMGKLGKDANSKLKDSASVPISTSSSTSLTETSDQSAVSLCFQSFNLTVSNPAMHNGLCGFRIHSQDKMQSLSKLDADIFLRRASIHDVEGGRWSNNEVSWAKVGSRYDQKVAHIRAKNVRRFTIDVPKWPVLFDLDELYINDRPILESILYFVNDTLTKSNLSPDKIMANSSAFSESHISGLNVDICFYGIYKGMKVCELESTSKLFSKTMETYGPIRMIFARPVLVIYGTNAEINTRVAIKDLAIYIVNSHYSSYQTTIRAVSDIEYKNGKYDELYPSSNLMFVGGPSQNRILRKLCFSQNENFERKFSFSGGKHDYYRGKVGSQLSNYLCYSPVQFNLVGNEEYANLTVKSFVIGDHVIHDDGVDAFALISSFPILYNSNTFINGNTNDISVRSSARVSADGEVYADEIAALSGSTTPHTPPASSLLSPSSPSSPSSSSTENLSIGDSIMGILMHSNTASGYLGLSRLAWPVVPPMVRGSFSHNMPDYAVFSANEVWSRGIGAMKVAGYWDADWRYDTTQAYEDF